MLRPQERKHNAWGVLKKKKKKKKNTPRYVEALTCCPGHDLYGEPGPKSLCQRSKTNREPAGVWVCRNLGDPSNGGFPFGFPFNQRKNKGKELKHETLVSPASFFLYKCCHRSRAPAYGLVVAPDQEAHCQRLTSDLRQKPTSTSARSRSGRGRKCCTVYLRTFQKGLSA